MAHRKNKLFEALKLIHRMEPSPGFSHLLGTTYHDMMQYAVDVQKNLLHIEMPLKPQMFLDKNTVSLSTYMAIMDDLTTYGLMTEKGRPGVSVSMRMDWSCPPSSISSSLVSITAETRKIGRNLAFTATVVRDARTQQVLCHGNHIKYLPMGFPLDFLLQSGWPLLHWWFNLSGPVEALSGKESSLVNVMTETFDGKSLQALPQHASLGGPVHGGCQAVVMELAAQPVAEEALPGSVIQSISIEYLSKPGEKRVDTKVSVLSNTDQSLALQVQLLCSGKVKAVGTISYGRPKSKR